MIDTNKLRDAMPDYAEAARCGDVQTRLEDIVIALCNEIDRLRRNEVGLNSPTSAGA